MGNDLWFLIFIKSEIKECDNTRIRHIFGKEMIKSWPEFYADYDGTNSFWKFWDLDQNNPVLKFVLFSANISVYKHAIGPEFGLMDSFLTLNKMAEQVFENSKILQNFGIKIESYHSDSSGKKEIQKVEKSTNIKTLAVLHHLPSHLPLYVVIDL